MALLAWALPVALASFNYPAALQAEVGVDCAPTCTVCHATADGGTGTVTQGFGVAMQGAGLTGGGDEAGLRAAVAALSDDGTDSDGDGTSDVDALAAGLDPNTGAVFCGEGAVPVETPTYGCVQHAPVGAAAALAAAGAALLARRRRTAAAQ
jgi:uncharacterized protein (TIGR03382 family)